MQKGLSVDSTKIVIPDFKRCFPDPLLPGPVASRP